MLIVPRSIPIFGCMTFGAWMILLCCKRTKPFFNYANKFMASFFLWFLLQVSVLSVLLIPTLSPHLRPKTSNPITHYFVRTHWIWIFICTDSGWTPLLVEFLPVMDGIVRWAQQEGSRPQWCLLFISRWKLFFFSQFSQHISLLGLFICASEGHIRRGGEWFRWFSFCLLFFFNVCAFFLWRNEKSFRVSYVQ